MPDRMLLSSLTVPAWLISPKNVCKAKSRAAERFKEQPVFRTPLHPCGDIGMLPLVHQGSLPYYCRRSGSDLLCIALPSLAAVAGDYGRSLEITLGALDDTLSLMRQALALPARLCDSWMQAMRNPSLLPTLRRLLPDLGGYLPLSFLCDLFTELQGLRHFEQAVSCHAPITTLIGSDEMLDIYAVTVALMLLRRDSGSLPFSLQIDDRLGAAEVEIFFHLPSHRRRTLHEMLRPLCDQASLGALTLRLQPEITASSCTLRLIGARPAPLMRLRSDAKERAELARGYLLRTLLILCDGMLSVDAARLLTSRQKMNIL